MTLRSWPALALVSVVAVVATTAACGSPDRPPLEDGGPMLDSGPPRCAIAADCADTVDCTTDTCVAATGACRHILTPALCAVGESCNPATGCEPGRACGTDAECADTDACTTMERCDPASRTCTYRTLDGDEDGDAPRVCGGGDCDDSRASVYSDAPELCDALDNDCDGAIDEGADTACGALEVCTAGACECAPGTADCGGTCTDVTSDAMNCGACDSFCEPGTCMASRCVCPGGLTSCIGGGGGSYCVDTDTSVTDCGGCGISFGAACTSGVGRCLRNGVFLGCAGGVLTCDATPGAPSAELCNGFDDDCDGTVDDGNPEGGMSCTSGLGACARTGMSSCVAGAVACDAVPGSSTSEMCNGVDDDCDGAVDESALCEVEVSTGAEHTCVRRSSGTVMCWGANESGQLGDGTTATAWRAPVAVAGLTDSVELALGAYHTCSRGGSGGVVCWGANNYGQLGDGTNTNRLAPTPVVGLTDAVELSAGYEYTCARRSSGAVVCWGRNDYGTLGDGTLVNRRTPTPVSGLTDAAEISASIRHTCARRTSGVVACWGDNTVGRLGDGTIINRLIPTAVSGLTDAVELSAGASHTCARRSSGGVACWGENVFGALGDGTGTDRLTPTPVSGIVDAVELGAGNAYGCVRHSSGAISCWGANSAGQLGDGTFTSRRTPVSVVGLTDAIQLSAHGMHTCARRSSGAVVCWGSNFYGQLGDGTMTNRSLPTPVVGL